MELFNSILNGGDAIGKEINPSFNGQVINPPLGGYSLTFPDGTTATNLTEEEYQYYRAKLQQYNDAYGVAYSRNVTAPSWSDIISENGDAVYQAYVALADEIPARPGYSYSVAPTTQMETEKPESLSEDDKIIPAGNGGSTKPASVAPPDNGGEEKKDGKEDKPQWLIPAVVLVGIVGVVALTSNSKKRR